MSREAWKGELQMLGITVAIVAASWLLGTVLRVIADAVAIWWMGGSQ